VQIRKRYRYSNTIVYNNFHSLKTLKLTVKKKIETAAQQIFNRPNSREELCAEQGQKCSLATLYAAGNMPEAY